MNSSLRLRPRFPSAAARKVARSGLRAGAVVRENRRIVAVAQCGSPGVDRGADPGGERVEAPRDALSVQP